MKNEGVYELRDNTLLALEQVKREVEQRLQHIKRNTKSTRERSAVAAEITYCEDVDIEARLGAKSLAQNKVATITPSCSEPVVIEPCTANRILGGFVLIDHHLLTKNNIK
jgi:sulfate adenylyltransferase subunit 1 (EFTu-like GTPase family)